jgi:hypothetical protein
VSEPPWSRPAVAVPRNANGLPCSVGRPSREGRSLSIGHFRDSSLRRESETPEPIREQAAARGREVLLCHRLHRPFAREDRPSPTACLLAGQHTGIACWDGRNGCCLKHPRLTSSMAVLCGVGSEPCIRASPPSHLPQLSSASRTTHVCICKRKTRVI